MRAPSAANDSAQARPNPELAAVISAVRSRIPRSTLRPFRHAERALAFQGPHVPDQFFDKATCGRSRARIRRSPIFGKSVADMRYWEQRGNRNHSHFRQTHAQLHRGPHAAELAAPNSRRWPPDARHILRENGRVNFLTPAGCRDCTPRRRCRSRRHAHTSPRARASPGAPRPVGIPYTCDLRVEGAFRADPRAPVGIRHRATRLRKTAPPEFLAVQRAPIQRSPAREVLRHSFAGPFDDGVLHPIT